uniref:Zmp:0000001267 n=1 Tax=Maylandia zebra TaxID=106582 RepID=A0A3P9BNC5_9CICH
MGHDTHGLNLQREVGLIGAVSFIGGTMIGSGIFISPQYVLSTIGSPGASFIIWSCCGLIAMLGSGAEYIYILRTAGKVVAFMFVFSFIMVMRPASGTGVALIFAEYAVAPFYSGCTPPQLAVKLMAAVSILVLAIINCLSVRLATGIQVVTMAVKVVALVVIILGGIVMLFQGRTENFEDSFEGTNAGISSIGIAFYQGLWSYDGWNTLNYLTEEVKHPEVSLRGFAVIYVMVVLRASKTVLCYSVGLLKLAQGRTRSSHVLPLITLLCRYSVTFFTQMRPCLIFYWKFSVFFFVFFIFM